MKKIILHVGTPKTGTTALQLFAYRHAQALREQGLYWPSPAGSPAPWPGTAHHLLAWSLSGQIIEESYWPYGERSPEHVWAALLDEIRACPEPSILISSEAFCELTGEHVDAIADFLSGFEVTPIIYFRRFDEYVQAIYSTRVLYGYPRERLSIDDFAKSAHEYLDYTRLLAPWRRNFGETLIVKPYHRSMFKDQSIICDMFEALGYTIDPSSVGDFSHFNASPPWNIIECARLMNRLRLKRSVVSKVQGWSTHVYKGGVNYELLAPSVRKQLIQRTIGFFEREFGDQRSDELWRYMRGEELPDSDAEWKARHRPYSFVVRTLLDVAAARHELLNGWVRSRHQAG